MIMLKIFSTLIIGFLFTFLNQEIWGKLVDRFKGFGGLLAATLIPGTMWIIGHGLNSPMINQTGSIWIDMAWAPAIGGITHSILLGKKGGKGNNFIAAIFAGILAAYVLVYLL